MSISLEERKEDLQNAVDNLISGYQELVRSLVDEKNKLDDSMTDLAEENMKLHARIDELEKERNIAKDNK